MKNRTLPRRLPSWGEYRNSIGWMLTLVVVALAVAPMTIVTSLVIDQADSQARHHAAAHLESVAEIKRSETQAWLNHQATILSVILADPAESQAAYRVLTRQASEAESAAFRTVLEGQLDAQTAFGELFLYGTDGRIVLSTTDRQIGKIVAGQPYFAPSLSALHIQPPYYEVFTGDLNVVISRPVHRPSGSLVGVLAGRLKLDELSRMMLQRTGLGATGETYLVSAQSNYLVTNSRFEGYPASRAYHSQGIDRALDGNDGTGIYEDYRGVEVVGAYRWLPELQSALLAEMNVSEALAESYHMRAITGRLVFLASAGAIIIGLLVTLRIARPIMALRTAAVAIAAGDYARRARVRRHDEVGQLAMAFNTMTQRLVQTIGELNGHVRRVNQMNLNLESKTLQLHEANQALEQQIRERQAADESLTAERNLLRTLIDNLPHQIYARDTRGRFTVSNRAHSQALGLESPLAMTGKWEPDLRPDGRTGRCVVRDMDVLRTGQALLSQEERAQGKAGGDVWLSISVIPIRDSRDQVTGLVGIKIDITERKRVEEMLRTAFEHEKAMNELKTRFSSMVSHEFRNPLATILSSSESLRYYGDRMGEQRKAEHFEKIDEQVRNLVGMLDEILAISKAQSLGMELHPALLDLDAHCRQIIGEMGQVAQGKCTIEYACQGDCRQVVADEKLMMQIIRNLLTNAIKYSPSGEAVRLTLACHAGNVILTVSDRGIGIPEADQQHLFQAFFRGSNVVSMPGTGLGLVIVKECVDAHAGSISFESTPGVGTTFTVTLPILPLPNLLPESTPTLA
ncbi:MAG: PAS domain S-box protein [Anaerolineae bacterium]|nr:PAS domain S-box protein [Anaerolineae bacterium]